MSLRDRLHDLGLVLPAAPKPLAAYVPALKSGDFIYVSGQLPFHDGTLLFTGAVPDEVTLEQAQIAARQCLLNGLAAAAGVAGGLDYIAKLIQINGFVQSPAGFAQQPVVLNGASELALELMGDAGKHTRTAVGVSSLPLNAPVEISFIFTTR